MRSIMELITLIEAKIDLSEVHDLWLELKDQIESIQNKVDTRGLSLAIKLALEPRYFGEMDEEFEDETYI